VERQREKQRASDEGEDRLGSAARDLLHLLRGSQDPGAAAAARAPAQRDWNEISALAVRHGVGPLLHRALQSGAAPTGVPGPVRARIAEERRATAFRNLRNIGEFERIACALRARGIPVIPLKGLHLADLVYGDISLRPMSDLDILVPRAEVGPAATVLQSLQYGFVEDLSAASAKMPDTTKCNLGLANPGAGTWLELHWSLLEPAGRYAPLVDEVWRAAAPARFGNAETLVMSPELLLLHVCAHLACGHVFLFSLHGLCDIAEIARAYPSLDWRFVADHGARHGLRRGIGAALRLARDHLGAAIPDQALASLGADTLDPDMLADAMKHLLGSADMPHGLQIAPNLLALAGAGTTMEKLAVVWKRIFVPRVELALLYGVPPHSARIWFYYAVRLSDLLRTHAAGAWALKVSDPALAVAAARHARLANWIGSA